jgi:hypothetical protein
MSEQQITTTKASLLKNLLLAALMAAALAVLVVLPAEYGIDPTGFGAASGLTALAPEHEEPGHHEEAEHEEPVDDDHSLSEDELSEEDAPFPMGQANAHDGPANTRKFEIVLKPLDEVEYKAVLATGEPMFYNWSVVSGEEVYVDFHGDPTEGEFPDEYFQSYQEGEMTAAQGSFTATFTGNHGWYWLNISENDITITLEATGYYSVLEEIYRGNQRDKYR